MKISQLNRERCDHCKKFVKDGQLIFSLHEILSDHLNNGFAICDKCSSKHKSDEYWIEWATRHK